MDMEVPEATTDGVSIADRDDFIEKYIESEKAKFGRDIDRATAEAEVDEWLLKQATFAPAKTRCAGTRLTSPMTPRGAPDARAVLTSRNACETLFGAQWHRSRPGCARIRRCLWRWPVLRNLVDVPRCVHSLSPFYI